jgi:E1A/CREB-binding protein
MKDWIDSGVNKATDIPYFEGDFWPSTIESLIEEVETAKASDNEYLDDSIEPEEPIEFYGQQSSNKRKLRSDTTHKKKNLKKSTSQHRIARKNVTNGSDLFSKIETMMKKHKAVKKNFSLFL